MRFQILSLTLLCLIFVKVAVCDKKIVCYYTNWAQYRNGAAQFLPKNIDPNLCDVIIYAFGQLTNNVLTTREWNDDTMIDLVVAHKKVNPSLKVLFAVGGWNAGSGIFSDLVSDSQARKKFVTTTVQFLKSKRFDGLDIDWEYPGSRDGSRPADKQLFTVLLSELSEAFKPYGLLLAAAVGVGRSTVDAAYDIPKISQYLDWINLMTYDFHGSWEFFTGFNAPLYKSSCESGDQIPLNVHESVQYWIANGAPREKLVLGIATYGRSFTLADPKNNLPGSATTGPGNTGKYVSEAGFLSYYEICQNILVNGYSTAWDSEHMVPFAYNNNQWVGFDNIKSVQMKADYISSQNLLGAMFWALDLDDFTGRFCNQNKYPLINAVKDRLNNNSITTTATTTTTTTESTFTTSTTTTISTTRTSKITKPTTIPTTTTAIQSSTSTTTTTQPSTSTSTTARSSIITTISSTTNTSITTSKNLCYDGDKYYPIRDTGCKSFYRCTYSDTPSQKIFNYECPDSLIFSFELQSCGWSFIVKC